jgi:diguanylate cyclase (GGDEF)-like protein
MDWSLKGRARGLFWTIAGTSAAIAITLAIDWPYVVSVSGAARTRALLVDILLPFFLAGPALFLLTSKIRQLAILQQKFESLASIDYLTSLPNRRAFTDGVQRYLQDRRKPPDQTSGALLIADVDHFKAINDELGHDQGDDALRLIGAAIEGVLRQGDLVGRVGGEEFGIFLPGANRQQASVVAERIREAIRDADFRPFGERREITVSVGGVAFRERLALDALYRIADRRLYDAKQNGRDRSSITEAGSQALAA